MNTSKIKSLVAEVFGDSTPKKSSLESLLSIESADDLNYLYSFADDVRRNFCGDGILLRGIVEFSSFCKNACLYCGINKNNLTLSRYRLGAEQILEAAATIHVSGVRTIVLQSGEDSGLDAYWLADIIKEIVSKFSLAVTLSVGEKELAEYRLWKEAGADRYLLKIETTNPNIYASLHPGMNFQKRLKCLRILKDLGYQTGSGNIIGLRGQTISDIADDILFFKREDFDMVGIGPFIPHGQTQLKNDSVGRAELVLKTLALVRITSKNVHLPATTALGSLESDFRIDALKSGANVIMPNFTPQEYRKAYEIYPGKRCLDEPVGKCCVCMDSIVESIGRFIDNSRGDSLKVKAQAC